jgi:hypothetical protein
MPDIGIELPLAELYSNVEFADLNADEAEES